jgi:hypothetical protein
MRKLDHVRVFVPYEGSNGPQKAMIDKINEIVDRVNELSKIIESSIPKKDK